MMRFKAFVPIVLFVVSRVCGRRPVENHPVFGLTRRNGYDTDLVILMTEQDEMEWQCLY